MGRVIDITALIPANRALIKERRQSKILESVISNGGNRVVEGTSATTIIYNGKITILPKIKETSVKEDIIA